MSDCETERISRAFYEALDRSGYPFQHAALRVGRERHESQSSRWVFEVAEFPVQTGHDPGTRIDFILKNGELSVCLLVECKRANPKLRHWCFARSPFVRRNARLELFIADRVRNESGMPRADTVMRPIDERQCYHLAIEVKGDEKGDPDGSSRGEIEGAVTQACRGLNGLIEAFATGIRVLEEKERLVLVPAVFTTARIWTSEGDISTAEVSTGKMPGVRPELVEREWVYYQYHQSPALKFGGVPASGDTSSLSDVLAARYLRTIPVVSAAAIGPFLSAVDLFLPTG